MPYGQIFKRRLHMSVLTVINLAIAALFMLLYLYQFFFLIIAYLKPHKPKNLTPKDTKIAVLVAARNEERVLPSLLESLKEQDYNPELFDVYVVADNCTDNTAKVAKSLGATVFERADSEYAGKGYALDFLIKKIEKGDKSYDAYLVFDADNTAEKSFLTELNKIYSEGYDCVTGYRAPTNYNDGFFAAGQGMCFLRDVVLLNRARMATGSRCFISGTGYMLSSSLTKEWGGFPFHTLTEDMELTAHLTVSKKRVGYAEGAVFFDEQARSLSQSFSQRLRWCKGALQVFCKYIGRLLKGLFSKGALACFDKISCFGSAYVLCVFAVAVNLIGMPIALATGTPFTEILLTIVSALVGSHLVLSAFCIPLTISEWKRLQGSAAKKIWYCFTFPFYMLTFIPLAAVALFKREVKWTPIRHGGSDKADMS